MRPEVAQRESKSAKIKFNQPELVGTELKYITQALGSGHIAGGGEFTGRCQQLLEQELGVARAFLTTSCTAALEMAALLLAFEPGDEIVIPAFTFVSLANAFALRGAVPVFADVRADTLNIDESKLSERLTSKTRAVAVMHYAGIACEMDSIQQLLSRRNIVVIEDNAHGLFGSYDGRPLGSFGGVATQSFHQTKNFTCGEGGALLINDRELIARAEIIWEKGTDRLRFLRGQVEKYTWVDLGSSYLPSEILAACLWAQLEARKEIAEQRSQRWNHYHSNLQEWAREQGVQLPAVPTRAGNAFHLYYLVLPSRSTRDELIDYLSAREIETAFHYVPLHLSKMGRAFGGSPGQCPVAEALSERLLRLPFHTRLTRADQDRVIEAVTSFR